MKNYTQQYPTKKLLKIAYLYDDGSTKVTEYNKNQGGQELKEGTKQLQDNQQKPENQKIINNINKESIQWIVVILIAVALSFLFTIKEWFSI